MKKYLLVSLVALLSATGVSAETYYEVNTSPDPHRQEYRPGQVIVKFKTDSPVKIRKASPQSGVVSGVNNIDMLLQELGVVEAEPLMPLTGARQLPRRLKAYNGQDIKVHDLSKLFMLQVSDTAADIDSIAGLLSRLPEVEFAEPNYLVYAQGFDSKAVDDPLYSQQWGIKAVNADQLWDAPPVTDKCPLIAILDTGVDIWHPDLQKNIWTNEAELTGSDGYDDDGNGYKDDLHGWDFVNQTGTIDDYNGHGTHCAGIAAASGGNGIGIVGANPDALIMPVTVMQSDGVGDIGTIIKGIDYAAANGADVISMSFGGYSHSIAEEQALARAYSKAVLVASAGNDGRCIYPHQCPPPNGQWGATLFPAGFTFVLGVQATTPDGRMADFSNYDEDGPIYFDPTFFSEEQMYNYELKAPGVGIMSTYPGGRYKALNGTSMACPLVAGAISRLITAKDYPTKELLFGDLIHTAKGNVDFMAAYKIKDEDRKPSLSVVSWRIDDELDQDGRFDAGEMINFYPIIRNEWGTAKNIKVWMELCEFEGKVVSFEQTSADFNKPLSSYAKAESAQPIRFRIADDVVDGRHIRLLLHAQCDGMDAPTTTEVTVTAENGVEIGGIIEHDMTLEPGVSYIVTRRIAVPDGVTLTIKPGAVLKFSDDTGIYVAEKGHLKAKGEPNNFITFTGRDLQSNLPEVSFNMQSYQSIPTLEYVNTEKMLLWSTYDYYNCIFQHLTLRSEILDDIYDGCVFYDCGMQYGNRFFEYDVKLVKNCNINVGNKLKGYVLYFQISPCPIISNNAVLDPAIWICSIGESTKTTKLGIPGYYGSALIEKVKSRIGDIDNPKFPSALWQCDMSNMLRSPNPQTPGLVWKVMVDGKDAQDEFELMPPLGVGRHKFEIFYSKEINHTWVPSLSMGVRPPYTQTVIADHGSWRTENIKHNFNNGPFTYSFLTNGDFESRYGITHGWLQEYSGYCFTGDHSWSSGKSLCLRSFIGKVYQPLYPVQNGVYKFKFRVKSTESDKYKNSRYIYANNDKTYITSDGDNNYEVTTTVTDNILEVGVETTQSGTELYLDDAELIFVEPGEEKGYPVSVYTAYLDIKGNMAIDGLNRIYVGEGTDAEGFPIPVENTRFNVEVAAAGSMSTGFMATPGIGKVELEWEQQDDKVDDILGYNLYRMNEREVTDRNGNISIVTDTIRINERLLDGTTYTDFDVVPGKRYDYYYKIMRTSMDENSPSKVVSVVPLTAQKGDANGSLNVDVADVVTEVSYITGGNPQPFIYYAADVNEDTEIDVLDIVGTVRLILYPEASGIANEGVAKYWIKDNTLWLENDVTLGGVQFTLNGDPATDTFNPLEGLNGMEVAGAWSGDAYTMLAYSMSGHAITPGVHPMLSLSGVADVVKATASDPMGHDVVTLRSDVSGMAVIDIAQMQVPTPNPFVDEVTIPYVIGDNGNHSVEMVITDLAGACVGSYTVEGGYGKHLFKWRPAAGKGIYLATLLIDGRTVQTAKLIKK